MKLSLLHSFAFALLCAGQILGQTDAEKSTEKFNSSWSAHVLPHCSLSVHHGKEGWYFKDAAEKKIQHHLYTEILGGGKSHYIVRDPKGYHILDTNLIKVTKQPFESISFDGKSQFTLISKGETSYFNANDSEDATEFTFVSSTVMQPKSPELGSVTDNKFKSKKIERLRLGIDMSSTLKSSKKGKNVIVTKNETIVYKGLTQPMLYYDFVITESKAPHSIYHPAYKKVFLTNCEQFWFVDSFLIVAFQGSSEKWIISNSGDVILTTVGEIRYYNYQHGGQEYSFFCDGRNLVNRKGDVIYHSDGELVGVGEHVIYANNRGAYLGDLSKAVQLKYTNFERFEELTCAQVSRSEWCLLAADSVVLSGFSNFLYRENDGLLICTNHSNTYVVNCKTGKIVQQYDFKAQLHVKTLNDSDYFFEKMGSDDLPRWGIFELGKGIKVEANYRSMGFSSSGNSYVVLTESCEVEYVNAAGQELFD